MMKATRRAGPEAAAKATAVARAGVPDRGLAGGRSTRRGFVGWSIAGFLLGAVFWHVVGFWDFLSHTVTQSDRDFGAIERVLSRTLADATSLAVTEQRAIGGAQNCTTLTRDPATGRTQSRPCIVVLRNAASNDAARTGAQAVAPTFVPTLTLTTAGRLDRMAANAPAPAH